MPTPIPFADDGDTRAWRGRPPSPAPRFPIGRFLLAGAAIPPLLAFMIATSWMCFEGIMEPPRALSLPWCRTIARRTGGWVAIALAALALVAGG
jgi:hypothetical protein